MSVRVSKPEINIRSKLTELEGSRVTYARGSVNNPFTSVTDAQASGVATGKYFFTNRMGQVQELFYDSSDGGWILYSSSHAGDTLFPLGQGRNSLNYTVNRNGVYGEFGTADPERDYLIGAWIDHFTVSRVRTIGWGRTAAVANVDFYTNRGEWLEIQWNATSIFDVVPRASVTFSGNSATSSLAAYATGDGIYADYADDANITANANQCTIGPVMTVGASGAPNSGCYYGHGANEGTSWYGEGWYNASSVAADAVGHTGWVR